MRTPVSIGVVGAGSWGTDVARVVEDMLPRAELRYLHDRSHRVELRLRSLFRNARLVSSVDEMLDDETLDAVVLATPPATHYELGRAVLEADKHLLVRPPLALRRTEAVELARLAESRRRRLAVAYRPSFTPAVRKLRDLLERGHLGELYYLDLAKHDRAALGHACNVLWGLGEEQVALITQLLGDEPVELTARGESYTEPELVDVAYCSLGFATGIWAHLHLSWLGPDHTYRVAAIGADRTAVIDGHRNGTELRIIQNDGDVISPKLPPDDSLRLVCDHFLKSLSSRSYSFASTREGARVISVLEALQISMEYAGAPETLAAKAGAKVVPIVGAPARSRSKAE